MKVHIIGNMSREYDGILGCDHIRKVGSRNRSKKGIRNLQIGWRKCDCKEDIRDDGARVRVIFTHA